MAAEGNSFPRMTRPGLYSFFPLLILLLYPLFPGKTVPLCKCPKPLQKGEIFCLLYYQQRLQSFHEAEDPLDLHANIISLVPNATGDYTCKLIDVPTRLRYHDQGLKMVT